MKALLTEDDAELADITARNLKRHGLAVDVAYSGEETLRLLEDNGGYDVIVLDLILPDVEGTDLLKDLKSMAPNVPVLALTARDAEEDRVKGILLGFDDYMTKPFSYEELIARLRVLYRSQGPRSTETVKIGSLQIRPESQTVFRSGVSLKLTLNEFRLLHYLATSNGQAVSPEELLVAVWDRNAVGVARVITAVSRLRKKIGDRRKTIIRTVEDGYTIT